MTRPLPPIHRRTLMTASIGVAAGSVLPGCRSQNASSPAAAGAWSTGGTAAMTAQNEYPDPFASGLGTSCLVTCAATIGPCHTTAPERRDISGGWDGIPVRLALRLVDTACQPMSGLITEIWHTNYRGGYSGDIVPMCTENEADKTADFFRGFQRSDASGVAIFDTVFPGWYRGRAVHIHYRILGGDYDPADSAPATVVSQLFFDPAIVQGIFESQPLYRDFGQPDTSLETDNVVGGETDKAAYLMDVARMSDGAMLASKSIVLSEEAACQMRGGGGGGGPGGAPPGGPGGGQGGPPPGGPGGPPPGGGPPPHGAAPGGPAPTGS